MSDKIEEYFAAIQKGDSDKVRQLLTESKDLSTAKRRGDYKYDQEIELDAYKFLGAYLGSLTGLHYAILLGQDAIARDIIEATFKSDLDITFGGNNTALHLATLLGARDLVKLLLERGASLSNKNSKGFSPVDVVDDAEMTEIFGQFK